MVGGIEYRRRSASLSSFFLTVRAVAEDGKGMFKVPTSNPFQGEIGEEVRFIVSLGPTTGKC